MSTLSSFIDLAREEPEVYYKIPEHDQIDFSCLLGEKGLFHDRGEIRQMVRGWFFPL